MKTISLFLSACFLTFCCHSYVYADHYDAVLEQYDVCTSNCETTAQSSLDALSCDYYGTRDRLATCRSTALGMYNRCNSNCKSAFDAERNECKDTKKMEARACKEDKSEAIDECRDLTGQAKRDCKKNARQDKRDCKKNARQEKRLCLDEADAHLNSCQSQCSETYREACNAERAAADACNAQAQPIFTERQACLRTCAQIRDAGLVGYNRLCPHGHGGQKGAIYTFVNETGATRYVYRPEPWPTADNTPSSTIQSYFTTLTPGQQVTMEFVCGSGSMRIEFKDIRVESSTENGEFFDIPLSPCCEAAQENTIRVRHY